MANKFKGATGKFLLFFILPLFLVLLVYQILLHPRVFGPFIVSWIENHTEAILEWEVQRSSLIYGFEFKKVRLLEKKNHSPLFTAERVRISYFLPSLLVGHVGIRELHLKEPRIYLRKQGAHWNWHAMRMGDREKKPRPKINELDFLFELRAYLLIKIENLALQYEEYSTDAQPRRLNHVLVENVDFHAGVLTRPISKLPLDSRALGIFQTLLIALNPKKPIKLEVQNESLIKGELISRVLIFHESSPERREFVLQAVLDTRKLSFYNKAGQLQGHAGLQAYIDTSYDAITDRLLVHKAEVKHEDVRWIQIQARLDHVAVPERKLRMRMAPATISLDRVDRLLATLSGSRKTRLMGGKVLLEELQVNGGLDTLALKGGVHARQVFLNLGDRHRIDNLRLLFTGNLDLYRVLPGVERPLHYNANRKLAFGIFHNLHVPGLQLTYNKARANGDISIEPHRGFAANLQIDNLNWNYFFPEYMQGVSSATLRLQAPTDFNFLDIAGSVLLKNGRYFLKRSRSGVQNIKLLTDLRLHLQDTIRLDINKMQLTVRNTAGERLIYLVLPGKLSFGDTQDYNINIKELVVDYPRLRRVLPGSIRDRLEPAKLYLSRGLRLSSHTRLRFNDQYFKIDGSSMVNLPYLKLKNVELHHNLNFLDNRIDITRLSVAGLRGALKGDLSGKLIKKKDSWYPELKATLRLARSEYIQVHENLRMQGSVDLAVQISKGVARGRLDIKNLNLAYFSGKCQKSIKRRACQAYVVDRMQLKLPFQHELQPRRIAVISKNPAREYFTPYGSARDKNLRVHSVYSYHNPRGEFKPGGFYFLGSPASAKVDGLAANLQYRHNALLSSQLRVKMFKAVLDPEQSNKIRWQNSGDLLAQNIYINLANLKTEQMEAGLRMQIKNLDLEPFLPASSSSYDGTISADIKLTASSLKNPLYHTTAYVSVYRISREFSGFVTRVIMPANVVALIVRNTVEIPGIRIELKSGLVYSYVKIKRAHMFPGIFIAPGSDEIKQERMPLARFLDKARSEVSDFGKETTTSSGEQPSE